MSDDVDEYGDLNIHYCAWASQPEAVIFCTGEGKYVSFGEKIADQTFHVENGEDVFRYTFKKTMVTCYRCNQMLMRRR